MNKGHCKYSNYGICVLCNKADSKCMGYENCEDYEEAEE